MPCIPLRDMQFNKHCEILAHCSDTGGPVYSLRHCLPTPGPSCKLRELQASSWITCKLIWLPVSLCNCMPACATVCEPVQLHASLRPCLQACASLCDYMQACMLMDLFARQLNS